MSRVTVYTTRHCPYRVSDKRLLSRKGVDPIEIDGVQSPAPPGSDAAALRAQKRPAP